MMQADYNPSSEYHAGPPVIQDALAHLGVFKSIEEVPARYRLQNYVNDLDADELWDAFVEELGDEWSEHTRKYVYGKAWREWVDFCEERGIHPGLPEPVDIEDHIAVQTTEINTGQTVYTNRFRPLYRFFGWLTFQTEYPHRYNPALMAVVLEDTVAQVWKWRLDDRVYEKYGEDNNVN